MRIAPATLSFSVERVGDITWTRTEGPIGGEEAPQVPHYELQGPNSDVVAGGSPIDGMVSEE